MTLAVKEIFAPPEGLVLRDADIAECLAGGMTPDEAVQKSFDSSSRNFELLVDGKTLAVWGFRPESLLGKKVYAWMLSTPLADKEKLTAGRASIYTFQYLFRHYDLVEVLVHHKYLAAHNWLAWLGFKTISVEQLYTGEYFRTMQLEKRNFKWAG